MFWSKFFVVKHDILLAMCDHDIIGRKLEFEEHEVEVCEEFYGERVVEDEETAVKLMSACTIGNLMGERIVNLAKERGFITEENIISIGGVPHAQFVKL